MKKLGLFFCLSLVSAFAMANDAQVGDAEAGKAKTLVCQTCHGTDGNSAIPMNPKLAGQHANYLVKQLKEFKLAMQTGGKEGRNNAIMGMQANMLSEQDMLDIVKHTIKAKRLKSVRRLKMSSQRVNRYIAVVMQSVRSQHVLPATVLEVTVWA